MDLSLQVVYRCVDSLCSFSVGWLRWERIVVHFSENFIVGDLRGLEILACGVEVSFDCGLGCWWVFAEGLDGESSEWRQEVLL